MEALAAAALALPVWIPIFSLSYFLGRKQFSLQALFILTTAEAISLAVCSLTIATFPKSPDINGWVSLLPASILALPLGAPGSYTAFGIGRKSCGANFWFYLLAIEFLSLVVVCGLGLPSIR
jgi:hypothetical protein